MTKLYLISPPEQSFIDDLGSVLEAGVDWFQYRRPNKMDEEAFQELRTIRSITNGLDIKLIVNNRPDLALAAKADGVHLGEEDLPVASVKDQWPELTVGRTIRPGQELNPQADYYGVGPTFGTKTKDLDHGAIGWNGLRKVLAESKKPVFAIGGIDLNNLQRMPADLDGIALIRAVWKSEDPVKKVERLRSELDEQD